MLPMNSSLSLTLDGFYTLTEVTLDPSFSEDRVWFDGVPAPKDFSKKVKDFMDQVRARSDIKGYAQIHTQNHVPLGAGLASSASGFAALAMAASKAYGLSLEPRALSLLARLGSGSASRSIFGGFVKWHKGHLADGSDSFSTPLLEQSNWINRLCMIAVIVNQEEKSLSSREGMARTVKTSPLYGGWLDSAASDLECAEKSIFQEDLKMLGEVMEHNALKMHATMLAAKPSVQYLNSGSFEVMQKVNELRAEGLLAYYTMDAGPNVKILCYKEDAPKIQSKISELKVVKNSVVCQVGTGVK